MNATPAAPERSEGGRAGNPLQPRSYASSVIPEPYRILGLKLLPFSLGHYLLLQRFDCAFVRESTGFATQADLILGVMICSMPPAEFLKFIETPDFEKDVAAWGKRIGAAAKPGRRKGSRTPSGCAPMYPFDFKEKADLFMRYLKDGWQEPPHINKSGGSASGDWVQNVTMALAKHLNCTLAEVHSMPMSQALADYFKLAENEGVIQLLTEADLEAMAANEKAMRELNEMLDKGAQPSTLNPQPV